MTVGALFRTVMTKRYDRRYFDTWYRKRNIHRPAVLRRKTALAVAMAEYHLGRPLRSVLDVGCGEGAWRAPLLRMRPNLHYLGLDSSHYAIERYGRSRNLRPGAFGDLAGQRFDVRFDLLVCSDVLHYLDDDEIERGLSGFADLCHGMAFIEVYCAEDDIEGDMREFRQRPAPWYQRAFAKAGLAACGSHCYLMPTIAQHAMGLEMSDPFSTRRAPAAHVDR